MTLEYIAWMSVLLCISQVRSAPMKCQLEGSPIQTSYNLIRDMGRNFPLKCIKENVFITFPRTAFASNGTAEERDSTSFAVYKTLCSIDALFDTHDLPTEWDENKLRDFQNIIYRQVEKSKCARRGKPGNEDPASTDKTTTLTKYFERLDSVLQEKDSFCAWEIVRKELVRTLNFILEHHSDILLWPKRI